MIIGRAPQRVANLERRSLLSLDPVRVDRVDDLDVPLLADLADDAQRVIEIAAHGDHARAFYQRLNEFTDGDGAFG